MKGTFKKLRESKGLTQRDIAVAIGATVQTISNWERVGAASRLTVPQVAKLCRVLGEDVETLAKLWEE